MLRAMCTLYALTRGQAAIRETFRAMVDRTGNLPSLPAVFPDQLAPVVRHGAEGRELATLRWGFPSPMAAPGNRPVTNIRNTASSFWRPWMGTAHRCLVPATSFAEYLQGKLVIPHWFGLNDRRPLFAFAGLWRPWTGTRGRVDGEHEVFAFLTTEPNAVVAPIHPKAMPVLLTTPDEHETWLTAPMAKALKLQRPLPNGLLTIVATGRRSDERETDDDRALPPGAPLADIAR